MQAYSHANQLPVGVVTILICNNQVKCTKAVFDQWLHIQDRSNKLVRTGRHTKMRIMKLFPTLMYKLNASS